MKEIYYTYNNEGIASCVILAVLNNIGALEISRSCLVLPFLLDDKTVKYFETIDDIDITLEKMMEIKPNLFSSFNKRYVSLLPVTINSLLLLKSKKLIKIDEGVVSILEELMDSEDVGDRYGAIKRTVPLFTNMFGKYETTDLYRLLNVQL